MYVRVMELTANDPQGIATRGAIGGIASFVVGYLLIWILTGTKVASLTISGPFGGSIPDWRAILWVFYDSHFVGTGTPEVFGPGGELWGGGDLVDTVGVLGVENVYAIPVVLLVIAGAVVAYLAGVDNPRDGMISGISITIGYLVAVVLGLFVAAQGGIAPSPLRALVIAGVVYPVAFGALGGTLVGWRVTETSAA